ncbi:MAG TPA: M48 family metallopeptidase [Opitutaceae bacterium]|nr:M48 family metallopeptidase [Opitutaceae bacterium]
MNTIAAQFLDGRHLAARPAEVSREDDRLIVAGEGFRHAFPVREVRVSDRLGRIPRYLYLPDGATVETTAHDAVDAFLPSTRRTRLARLLHWLESHTAFAAGATALLLVAIGLTMVLGLPVAARHLALQVPDAMDRRAGEVSLAAMSKFTQPSGLSAARRREIEALAADLAALRGLPPPRVEFRSMGGRFPNAFALPGRIIVVTDELVEVAGSDGELQAVLAHELGHVHHRHSLQGVFRGSAALLVVTLVSGDLSALTTFSASIPFVLLQRGYSREFEEEADDYAAETLRLAGVDLDEFAAILGKLEGSREGLAVDYSYLSTHPHTDDRIKRIDRNAPRAPRSR